MDRVARLAMGSLSGAVLSSLAFFILGLFFSPFLIISAALITLVSLRQGPLNGLKVVFYATALYFFISLLIFKNGFSGIFLPVLVWLPMLVLSAPLRRGQSYEVSLILCGVFIFLYACLLRIAVGDVEMFWMNKMQTVLDVLSQQSEFQFSEDQLKYLSSQIHIWWLILLQSCMVGTLLLARSWQSKLYYPGGFGEEFRRIRLSRGWVVILFFVIMVAFLVRSSGTGFSVFGDLLAILLVFFALQGLAVVHHRSKTLGLSIAWLVGLYLFLFLVPQITGLTLGITGIVDSIADFRRLKDS